MKRLTSLLTAITLVLCLLPMPVNATESTTTEATVTEVATADELVAALAADEDVIFTKDITVEATKGGYSLAGIVQSGETIDGNGYSLTVNGANATWDCAIYTQGGTIKNLTIGGAFRGVFTAGCSEDIILDNVVLDNVCYTFNSDGANANYGVIIKNSTVNGWTSYSGSYKSVVFENCKLGAGTGGYSYAFIRPYSDTTFTNCTFEEGYEIDAARCDNKFVDCMVGKQHITQESIVDLLGEGATKATVLAATHKLVEVEKEEATCTKAGVKAYFECQLCEEAWFDEECKELVNSSEDLIIPVLDHTSVTDAAVAATCTEAGLTEGAHCSVCKEVLKAQEVVKATGHTSVTDAAVAATCTEAGLTEGAHCSVCKEVLKAQEVVKATGHKFVDGVCACGLSIKVEAEVTDKVPSTSTEGSTSGSTEEKVEVPKVEEVTVIETTETKKAEASVKAEATEIVATVITEGTDKLVEDKVVSEETAANLEAVTEAINGNGAEMVAAGLLTEEEVKVIEEAVQKGETVVKAEITVSEVKATEVEKKVQTAMEEKAVKSIAKEAVVAQYLDVTVALKAAGKELGTIDKLEEPITITVAIPEELKVANAKYYVLRNHDGEVTLLSTTLNEDGTISFTTDQFSTYALAYTKEAVKGSPATGDNSAVMAYGMMSVAALAVVVVLKKRESFER